MICILNELVAKGEITEAQANECRARRAPHQATAPLVSAKVEKRAAKAGAWADRSGLRERFELPLEESREKQAG